MLRISQARVPAGLLRRDFSTIPRSYAKRRGIEDDIHRPSLSGSSVGHLISEISGTKPGMEGLRPEGQTMSEEQRTFARRVVTWIMGVPIVLGTAFVGGQWAWKRNQDG